jgi:LmbE family N-acetylglucosaminyl deacetylase
MNRLTVLSPHRDDAAFSLYLSLKRWCRSGIKVTVLNFFTVSAYGKSPAGSGPEIISAVRRTEDRRVLARIDRRIQVLDCELLDAPLRLGIPPKAVFHPETQLLAGAMAPEVASLIRANARNSLLVAPLALGGHVDHFAVYQAATSCPIKQRLAFYEDLPYVAWTSDEMLRQRIRETEARTQVQLRSAIILQEDGRWQKQHGIAQYRSQIAREEAALISKFSVRYAGGERLWIPKHSRAWAWLAGTQSALSRKS